MKIKICGMKYKDNIKQIAILNADMLGFIFYEKSIRFAGMEVSLDLLRELPVKTEKVAVFADDTLENILKMQHLYHFDRIQLHGNESPEFCRKLAKYKIKIIKAFGLDESFDFSQINFYQPYCSYFLFDTKGKDKGGNGVSFNWNLLNKYELNTPFFLSGGVGLDNINNALQLKHPQFTGIDINSKVEIAPGIKSVESVTEIIRIIKNK